MDHVNYTKDGVQVNTAYDGIVIVKHIAGLTGGRALDTEGYAPKVVPCGLPIITDGNGKYKPLAPVSNAFTLPDGYQYAGICGAATLADKGVSIVTAAVVNEGAMLNSIAEVFPEGITNTSAVNLTALKGALPHLVFNKTEVADAPTA